MLLNKQELIDYIHTLNSDYFEVIREMTKPTDTYYLPTKGGGITYLRPIHTSEKVSLTINFEIK